MNETTRLERRTREIADLYMETHPGVPRQEAKRRCRHAASVQIMHADVRDSVRRFMRSFLGYVPE